MNRYFLVFLAGLAALGELSCSHKVPAGVAAAVNGYAITTTYLEKIYQSQYPEPIAESNEDQVMAQRLDLLSRLITAEIMWQRSEKLGITATDADVDTEINKSRAPYTKDEFDKRLAERHMNMDDLRTQVRRDLTINKLINHEITSHISITDADVADFYNANKAMFDPAEPTVHMAQILVTPQADPNVRNLKNSKAQNPNEAKAKIQDIMRRLQQGEDFNLLAQSYSEDPSSAPNGGDMGFVPAANLEKLAPEVRKAIDAIQPGSISPIIAMGDGYRIIKVFEREPAGQRELTDPRVQQNIRDTLMNRKEQVLQAAYYEVARNNAKVLNYLAQQVVDNAGKK
ncbi:MAG TPA: peptidylprolyl isomerase [Bryobacteraceae bacterium]|jgi:peptidyl-prolyl cis-trans isomerase SurA|nr:peptidylprolyl isomerase [Bryobacteraceae bacterium]